MIFTCLPLAWLLFMEDQMRLLGLHPAAFSLADLFNIGGPFS